MLNRDHQFWVTPTKAPIPRLVKLCTADQYVPKQWIPRVLFFPVSDEQTPEQVYEQLREGLSRTISQIPVLTGRVVREVEGASVSSIQIGDDAGVEFIFKNHLLSDTQSDEEAAATFPPYAKLRADHFPMRNLAACGAPKSLLLPVCEGGRLFTAQANFMPGGLALLFGVAHLAFDATAWAAFVRLWARHTADASRGVPPTDIEEPSFENDRQKLSYGTPNQTENDWSDPLWTIGDVAKTPLNLAKPLPLDQQATLAQRFGQPNIKSAEERNTSQISAWRVWYFSPQKLKELKQAASVAGATQWISTMDALFALFWYRTAVLRHLGEKGHEISRCREPIDLRPRMKMDPNYIGNAVSMMETQASVAEIENLRPESALATLAQKIRKTILEWKISMFQDFVGMASVLPSEKGLHHPTSSVMDPNLLINDHSKLAVYGCDWGTGIGPLERVRGPEPDFPIPGISIAMPFPMFSDGGIEVATVLDQQVNLSLVQDDLFMRYAEIRYAG